MPWMEEPGKEMGKSKAKVEKNQGADLSTGTGKQRTKTENWEAGGSNR